MSVTTHKHIPFSLCEMTRGCQTSCSIVIGSQNVIQRVSLIVFPDCLANLVGMFFAVLCFPLQNMVVISSNPSASSRSPFFWVFPIVLTAFLAILFWIFSVLLFAGHRLSPFLPGLVTVAASVAERDDVPDIVSGRAEAERSHMYRVQLGAPLAVTAAPVEIGTQAEPILFGKRARAVEATGSFGCDANLVAQSVTRFLRVSAWRAHLQPPVVAPEEGKRGRQAQESLRFGSSSLAA